MKIPANVLAVLRAATTDGPQLHLAGPRMTPKQYQRVAEVIEGAGGRWDKITGAHVFPGDAADAIAAVLASGHVTTLREARQASQHFPTPPAVVARLLDLAAVEPDMVVLEPSAGRGAIAYPLAAAGALVDCYELGEDNYRHLLDHRPDDAPHIGVTQADFLAVPPNPIYDRVVMNPPFTKGADVQHVRHALRFLKPGGRLAAVMSWGVTYGGGETARFRALVEQRGGTVEAVPQGAFAESGTDVDTILVTIPATRPADAKPTVWPVREIPVPEAVELRSPLEILAEIRASMREADAVFADLERMFTEPIERTETVVPLPAREGQLSFDEIGEAS